MVGSSATSNDFEQTLQFLQGLKNVDFWAKLEPEQRVKLLKICGEISRPSKEDFILRNKAIRRARKNSLKVNERKLRAKTGIRDARTASVFQAPRQLSHEQIHSSSRGKLHSPRSCYVCKKEFIELHHFYDAMCPACGDFNYAKRFQSANLDNQVALITGARLKIGYQSALMMLRAQATVIVTTRFPADAAKRYALENDFDEWRHRLHIFGLDLRHTPSVEIFAGYIEEKFDRLDILINNAAQTVRRPPGFYSHLMSDELSQNNLSEGAKSLLQSYRECLNRLEQISTSEIYQEKNLPVAFNSKVPAIGLRASARLSQIPYSFDDVKAEQELFPAGKLDADLQQVDLRKTNSWRLRLGEVPTAEMLELQLINSVAPFVLCNRLVRLMKKDYTGKKHVVNVSAMEGKFHRFKKADRHPHTNMAKAALNMLTHTAAGSLAEDGIFMNAVDTGWVTDEDPQELSLRKQELHDFQPPLDIVDGAARVCDPFFDGINTGKHWNGKFLKDYFPIDW